MYVSYSGNNLESLLASLKKILKDKGYKEVFEEQFHLRPSKNFIVHKGSGEFTNQYFRIQVSFKDTPFEFFDIECWFDRVTFEKYLIGATFAKAGHYEGKLDINNDIYESNLKEELFTDVKSALKRKTIASWQE